jgi:hypothetical protein
MPPPYAVLPQDVVSLCPYLAGLTLTTLFLLAP